MTDDQESPAGPAADRARSFGAIAAAYASHRPGYPDAAVRWGLAALGPADERGPVDVLDLAAGTGKLTEALMRLAADERIATITAVEPDQAMLDILRGELPGVRAVAGTAEEIPLPDASVHAVLVGQALHWFDLDRATAEIVRVLRPGGVVAALWNIEDHDVD